MSLSWTRATLRAEIQNTLDGDTSSTGGIGSTANQDLLIRAAEERILTELPLVIFDGEDDITLTINVATVTKPTGFVTWRSATYVDANNKRQPLELRSLEYLQDYCPDDTVTGAPKFLADYSATQWRVGPVPSASRSGKALFVKRPTSLADTASDGTWISTNLGLLLQRACFANGEKFIKSDERAPLWEQDYLRALAAAQNEFRHLLRPGFAPIAAMPKPKEER